MKYSNKVVTIHEIVTACVKLMLLIVVDCTPSTGKTVEDALMLVLTIRDMQIILTAAAIVKMSNEQVAALKLYCPKKAYYQMETSGSPSCWTEYGEYEIPREAILSKAREILAKNEECENIPQWDYDAHIRLVF